MKVSIIIPTYNEEEGIEKLVLYLLSNTNPNNISEVIVVDAGSKDRTVEVSSKAGAKVIHSKKKGRGAQMNVGAEMANGEVLYFLHADSYPPPGFDEEIIASVNANYKSGCYRLAFDHNHWFLRANSWFTKFNYNRFRFGDQSLFLTKDLFKCINGFREDLQIMEDQEIIYRIRKHEKFKVLKRQVTTSARKYLENGIFKMQFIFFLIYSLYHFGVSQDRLVKLYKRLIAGGKL